MNPLLRADSYKYLHSGMYPDGIKNMWAYGEARIQGMNVVPFGMQIFTQQLASERITKENVDELEEFMLRHLPGQKFNRAPFDKIVTKYGGRWPVIIWAIPEGTIVPSNVPLYVVTLADPDPELAFLPAFIETRLQRAVWYPTTIATLDHQTYTGLKARYDHTGSKYDLLPFALHDFGGRGVTCGEQAEIGGAAHLVHFQGSDTVEGIFTANRVYKDNMAAFSVAATEHSIQCSFGEGYANQLKYLGDTIKKFGKPGGIVSLVIDGYDTYAAVKILCTALREQIIGSGAKVVFRPDSGDMLKQTLDILKAQCEAFGYTVTDKGFKTPKHVGLLWGDGVDRENMLKLLDDIAKEGYAADCVVFGSGGALLQKVNRDTLKFAQKTSAVQLSHNNVWVSTAKKTPGKVSKGGPVSTMAYNNDWGQAFRAYDTIDYPRMDYLKGEHDAMVRVFDTGEQCILTTLAEVRERATRNT